MVRKDIYLRKQQDAEIRLLAKKAGKPAAEVIRELIDRGLTARPGSHKRGGLAQLAKTGITGGPKDLAARADDYLYGKG